MSIREHLKLSIEKVLSKSNLEHSEESSNDLNFWISNLCFGNSISFWKCQNFLDLTKDNFSPSRPCPKHLGILPKMNFDFQKQFRSFLHDLLCAWRDLNILCDIYDYAKWNLSQKFHPYSILNKSTKVE